MRETPKLTKAAKEYMRPALFYSIYDCCDSMRESEKLEARFNALADDKFTVHEYIEKFLLEEYIDAIIDVGEENGVTVTPENWKEFLSGTPSSFPDKIKNYFDKKK